MQELRASLRQSGIGLRSTYYRRLKPAPARLKIVPFHLSPQVGSSKNSET